MLLAPLRLGILLATLVASLDVAAAPRFWTLTDVQFADGAVATGYFSYDDATGAVANWNVRVGEGASVPTPQIQFFPHTHVPGNSAGFVGNDPPFYPRWNTLYFYSLDADKRGLWRSVLIAPLAPLDGNSAAVAIDVSTSRDFFEDWDSVVSASRRIIAGSLVPTTIPPPVTIVPVVEFYHQDLDHYFITASATEMRDLDTGVHPGWVRTGESFKAYAAASNPRGSISPVCRYYGNPLHGLGHFYSADVRECFNVVLTFALAWRLENDNAFQINLPDLTTGTCPTGTVPVYRLWGNSNHRYTTSVAIKMEMLAAGYVVEGYASNAAMCAIQ